MIEKVSKMSEISLKITEKDRKLSSKCPSKPHGGHQNASKKYKMILFEHFLANLLLNQ